MHDSDEEWKRWVNGVLVPLAGIAFGIWGLIQKSFTITVLRVIDYPMTGLAAMAASAGFIALCVLWHWFFFWENSDNPPFIRTPMVVLSAVCVAIAGLVCAVALYQHL